MIHQAAQDKFVSPFLDGDEKNVAHSEYSGNKDEDAEKDDGLAHPGQD